MLPQRDVTLLARRRVLPLVSYVAYASVTGRQTPATFTSLAPTLCRWASNNTCALNLSEVIQSLTYFDTDYEHTGLFYKYNLCIITSWLVG